jgi:hypothetical protein
MLEKYEIKHNSPILKIQKMHVHTNIREGALVVFHILLIRVQMGPRLTMFICLLLLLATFMIICI